MDAMKILIVAAGLMGVSGLAAAAGSPVGTWRSIDDKTKKERSIIRITEDNDELKGVVEKVFDQPGDDPDHLCKECKGERKDKPVIGMTILWGLKKDGDVWAGGEILDPKNRKTYPCKMTLSADRQSLNARGFIALSLLGTPPLRYRE